MAECDDLFSATETSPSERRARRCRITAPRRCTCRVARIGTDGSRRSAPRQMTPAPIARSRMPASADTGGPCCSPNARRRDGLQNSRSAYAEPVGVDAACGLLGRSTSGVRNYRDVANATARHRPRQTRMQSSAWLAPRLRMRGMTQARPRQPRTSAGACSRVAAQLIPCGIAVAPSAALQPRADAEVELCSVQCERQLSFAVCLASTGACQKVASTWSWVWRAGPARPKPERASRRNQGHPARAIGHEVPMQALDVARRLTVSAGARGGTRERNAVSRLVASVRLRFGSRSPGAEKRRLHSRRATNALTTSMDR